MIARTALPVSFWLVLSLVISVSAAPPSSQQRTELRQKGREDLYYKRGLLGFAGLQKEPSYERRPDRLNDMLSNVGQKKLKSSHLEKLTKAELYQYGGEHFYRLDLDQSAKLAKHLRDYCLEEAKVRARAMDSGKVFQQENRMNAQRMHIVPGDPNGNGHDGYHRGSQQSMTAIRLEEISRAAQKNIEQMSALAVKLRNHIDSLHDSRVRLKTTAKINQDLDTIDLLVTRHDLFDPKKEAKKNKADTQAREKAERKQRERDEAKKAAAASSHTKASFFGWPLQGEMGKVLGFHTFHHEREPSMVRTEGSRSTNSPEGSSRDSSVTSESRFRPWSGVLKVGESSQSSGSSGSTSSSSTSSRGRKDKAPIISEKMDLLDEKEGGIFKDRTKKQGEEFTDPRD